MIAVQPLAAQVGVAPACQALGVSRASFYRRQRSTPGHQQPRPTPARALCEAEREQILDVLAGPRFVDRAPAEVVATLLDEGHYLCSERTMYRILAADQPVRERRNQREHPQYTKPELVATAPNQTWSWDITKLLGPVLARGKCATGRAWVYVRDDRPFGGPDPPAALFRYSRDRSGDHPVEHLKTFAGIFQADIYAGYNALYVAGRSPGPVTEAACWSHSRRKFFELADIAASKRRGKNAPPISPLALEAVKRIDVLFDIERGINGDSAEHRLAVRKELSAPVLADLKDWMQAERRKLSRHSPVAKAMDYMLRRWELFARFLDDGRICLTNNAAERALRGIALGRKSWLFAGSDRGGVRAAAMCTLIGTAKLNDVDPQAWLADVLGRIAETPQTRLEELLPWNWVPEQKLDQAA